MRDLDRSILASAGGLPVYAITAPPGSSKQAVAALTFYVLRDTPDAIALLSMAQLQQLSLFDHDRKMAADYKLLRRLLRRKSGGSGRTRDILAAAYGVREASRILHRSVATVANGVASARYAVADEDVAYASHLLCACSDAGIADPSEAPRAVKERARAALKHSIQESRKFDAFAVMGTDMDNARACMIRDGVDFIVNRCGEAQPCPDRTVKVDSGAFKQHRPRIDLRKTPEELYRLYTAQGGKLSKYTFRRYCVLPEMKPLDAKTCLCRQCELVLCSTTTLEDMLREKVRFCSVTGNRRRVNALANANAVMRCRAQALIAYIDTLAAPAAAGEAESGAAARKELQLERQALLKEARNLQSELAAWRGRMKEQVHRDPLSYESFFGEGKLNVADLEAPPLGDLFLRVAGLVLSSGGEEHDAALEEWVCDVLSLEADLLGQLEHFKRWAVQEARFEQCKQLLVAAAAEGKRYVIVMKDFKEKLACNHSMRAEQSDYWDNSSVSCFGAVVMFVGSSNTIVTRHIDLLSDDTTQDSTWMACAFPKLGDEITAIPELSGGIDEFLFVCDNAYHFHNGFNFAGPLLDFRARVGARRFGVLFWEAGEGKSVVDTHFANVGRTIRLELRSRSTISGVAELVEIVANMPDTVAFPLQISRADASQRVYTYEGVMDFKSFFLRADFEEWRVGKTELELLTC